METIWPELQRLLVLNAAQIAFELAEELRILDLISAANQRPEAKLSYFVNAFLVHDIQLWGRKSPSTVSRQIPKEEFQRLHHISGTNSISDEFMSAESRYDDVFILRANLNEYLKSLQASARKVPK